MGYEEERTKCAYCGGVFEGPDVSMASRRGSTIIIMAGMIFHLGSVGRSVQRALTLVAFVPLCQSDVPNYGAIQIEYGAI